MRTNEWLEEKMYEIWEDHFNDIPRLNKISIRFGRRSRAQLGSIKWLEKNTNLLGKVIRSLSIKDENRITLITITKYFQDLRIPENVVIGTIIHEMCHYAHGFSSPLEQRFRHPHKGGVITKELKKRGLYNEYRIAKKWLKANWRSYISRSIV